MLEIVRQTKFKKDIKLIKKQGKNLNLLKEVIKVLIEEEELPSKYKDHILLGNYANTHECHIQPDWLLIYRVEKEQKVLHLIRTGSHSELFY
jgi:mRNA interferase YafQ